ncbi:hypothetical protein DLAC_00256 [Tieghemostelium lacteum]|uniref:NADH dehydrogenase [ubiquinone] 1 beta subcomplex subunit 7 n=1 Tax=Tieghemostelium lacteum TaxID=361077 RepID=A0A152A9I5_TIELA|nr:hypothetical protein DLAC_00256 [Tieghemostelium lacteum]|eukprot:KYR02791.1 hypothetical protein DLAC_00256 [Tieghemostelium lacteum]
MISTQKELDDNNVPLNFRDFCSHLLIDLNNCRVKNYYLPWRCSEERHAYEQCQYDEYIIRMGQKEQLVADQKRQEQEKNNKNKEEINTDEPYDSRKLS